MKWEKVLTRPFHLLQVYYTQEAYLRIPGFTFQNSLAISKKGAIKKYIDPGELERFYEFINFFFGCHWCASPSNFAPLFQFFPA